MHAGVDGRPPAEMDAGEARKNTQELIKFFREAIPSWQGTQVGQVVNKLAQVGIHTLPGLLHSLDEDNLNARLRRARLKTFTPETLKAMRNYAAGENVFVEEDNYHWSHSQRDDIWEVVGGGDRGGIIVRPSYQLGTTRLPCKLSVGSIVKQLELCESRLFYLLLKGGGPRSGWVTTHTESEHFLRKVCPQPDSDRGQASRSRFEELLRCETTYWARPRPCQRQDGVSVPAAAKEEDEIIPPPANGELKCPVMSLSQDHQSSAASASTDEDSGSESKSAERVEQLLSRRKEEEASGMVMGTRRMLRRELLTCGSTPNYELTHEDLETLAKHVAEDALAADCELIHQLQDLECAAGLFEQVQQLINRPAESEGGDRGSRGGDGARGGVGVLNESALVAAIAAGSQAEVLRCIEEDGVDVNARDVLGETPLFEAVQNGHVEIVTTLLEHGADPSIKSHSGVTCSTFAVDPHMSTLIETLQRPHCRRD